MHTEFFGFRLHHPLLLADGYLRKQKVVDSDHLKSGVVRISDVSGNAVLDLEDSQAESEEHPGHPDKPPSSGALWI